MIKLSIIAYLCLRLAPACLAQLPPLPDPVHPYPTAAARTVKVGNTPSADPSYARSVAAAVVSKVGELTNIALRAETAASALTGKIAALQAQKQVLEKEKAKVMEDFRNGFFCSECHRSRTELGGDVAFWNHIAENARGGRHAVPASAEEMAAKAQTFDGKLAALDQQIEQQTRERISKVEESRYARSQIDEGFGLWRAATQLEKC